DGGEGDDRGGRPPRRGRRARPGRCPPARDLRAAGDPCARAQERDRVPDDPAAPVIAAALRLGDTDRGGEGARSAAARPGGGGGPWMLTRRWSWTLFSTKRRRSCARSGGRGWASGSPVFVKIAG